VEVDALRVAGTRVDLGRAALTGANRGLGRHLAAQLTRATELPISMGPPYATGVAWVVEGGLAVV
jgi:hypothetical protein